MTLNSPTLYRTKLPRQLMKYSDQFCKRLACIMFGTRTYLLELDLQLTLAVFIHPICIMILTDFITLVGQLQQIINVLLIQRRRHELVSPYLLYNRTYSIDIHYTMLVQVYLFYIQDIYSYLLSPCINQLVLHCIQKFFKRTDSSNKK